MKNIAPKFITPKHAVIVFAGLFCIFFSVSSMAIILEIISMEEAIEAPSIKINLDNKTNSGTITVEGCSKCPLTLDFDDKTRFTYKGKSVSAKKAIRYSKTDNLVTYDAEKKYVNRVKWH